MAIESYAFNPLSGETPETATSKRAAAAALAARIFGRTPQNLGEGLSSLGQAAIAGMMTRQANEDQAAGVAGAQAQLAKLISGGMPSSPANASALPTTPSVPAPTGPVVPNDSNALPGQAGMNLALADRVQDFVQDNPGTAMTSGFRSNSDQARLYADRGNNPNPVAAPGTSNHERGMAADIGGMTPEQRTLLPQYGLAQPVRNDPPHVELAPNVQMAQAAPQTANDGSELPANAQPTQGTLPTSSNAANPLQNASTIELLKLSANPFLKSVSPMLPQLIQGEITRRAEAAQQANDPLRRENIIKAQRDNQPVGASYHDADGNLVQKDALGNEKVLVAADKTPTSVSEYKYYRDNFQPTTTQQQPLSYSDWDITRRRSSATNVDTGTIPEGYQKIVDPISGAVSMRPIPGGPKDTAMQDKTKADSQATASSVITNAANLARQAINSPGLPATGTASGTISSIGETNAAELRRQVDVLKANASLEALNQMRQQSKTGGALGSVTEGEERLLANKLGAIDPKAPREKVLSAIDDYERSLLQTVHGKQAGDAIFEAGKKSRTTPLPPKAGTVQGGYMFKGGDPSKRENWEPVT
jgi:hypothetical protein